MYSTAVSLAKSSLAWPGARQAERFCLKSFEETATQLGYLGLIMIVFEGGLATSAKSVGNSLLLSICVALTGIAVPIALSFALIGISHATRLQAFAAGRGFMRNEPGHHFQPVEDDWSNHEPLRHSFDHCSDAGRRCGIGPGAGYFESRIRSCFHSSHNNHTTGVCVSHIRSHLTSCR